MKLVKTLAMIAGAVVGVAAVRALRNPQPLGLLDWGNQGPQL